MSLLWNWYKERTVNRFQISVLKRHDVQASIDPKQAKRPLTNNRIIAHFFFFFSFFPLPFPLYHTFMDFPI